MHSNVTAPTWSSSCCLSRPACRCSPWRQRIRRYIIISWYVVTGSSPLSLRPLHTYSFSLPPFPSPLPTMTDAHERITLPPISSFDISPSSKHHSQFQAGPSRRGAHIHGSSSWDGSSAGSNHLRNEFDDISYRCGTFTLDVACCSTSYFRHHRLDPAQVDTTLLRALIVAATLRPDKHAVTITRHTPSQPSW